MGIVGLWLGKICSEYSIFFMYLAILYTEDWERLAKEASEKSRIANNDMKTVKKSIVEEK